MRAEADRSAQSLTSERRSRRTDCLSDALRFQLDACREDGGLDAIVVADDLGFCIAHSGDAAHVKLAARLPGLADPSRSFDDADGDEPLHLPRKVLTVTTFSIAGSTLHACMVGSPRAGGLALLERVSNGFSRMLA
jgi:hypothetical protein